LRQAASRRAAKPSLPFNPQNPYDAPAVISESVISTDLSDTESRTQSVVSGISSAYAGAMQPPPLPTQTQTSQTRRRHRNQPSAEAIEIEAHAQRVQEMRERVEALRQQKEEAELMRDEIKLRKEIEELEAWTQQNKET
jgi:hypothetical protein